MTRADPRGNVAAPPADLSAMLEESRRQAQEISHKTHAAIMEIFERWEREGITA